MNSVSRTLIIIESMKSFNFLPIHQSETPMLNFIQNYIHLGEVILNFIRISPTTV